MFKKEIARRRRINFTRHTDGEVNCATRFWTPDHCPESTQGYEGVDRKEVGI
jgi:hypothetical protein